MTSEPFAAVDAIRPSGHQAIALIVALVEYGSRCHDRPLHDGARAATGIGADPDTASRASAGAVPGAAS